MAPGGRLCAPVLLWGGQSRPGSAPLHTPVRRGDVRCLYHLWMGSWDTDELTSRRLRSAADATPPVPTQLWLVISSKD